jgi:hypothetical protein
MIGPARTIPAEDQSQSRADAADRGKTAGLLHLPKADGPLQETFRHICGVNCPSAVH